MTQAANLASLGAPMIADTSGNVGIGTSSPLTPVHAVGAIQSQRSGAAQYARMINSGGTATFISDNQASSTYTGFQFQGLSTASGTPVTYATIDGSGRVTMPFQPAFGVFANSPTTNADIVFSGTYTNVGGYYNTSTGIFTAPIAGRYRFTFQGLANGGSGDAYIKVNGATYGAVRGNNTTATISTIFSLAANDAVKITVGGVQFYSDGAAGWCTFTGELIG